MKHMGQGQKWKKGKEKNSACFGGASE